MRIDTLSIDTLVVGFLVLLAMLRQGQLSLGLPLAYLALLFGAMVVDAHL